jgi:hypothetical protein
MQSQTLTLPLYLSIKFSLKPSPPFWLCVTKMQPQTLLLIVKILLLQVSFSQCNENQRAQTFVTKSSIFHKKICLCLMLVQYMFVVLSHLWYRNLTLWYSHTGNIGVCEGTWQETTTTYDLKELLKCVLNRALRQSTECGVRTITKTPLMCKYKMVQTEACLSWAVEQVSRWYCIYGVKFYARHPTVITLQYKSYYFPSSRLQWHLKVRVITLNMVACFDLCGQP